MSNSASPNLLESFSITLSDLVARTAPAIVSVHSQRARSSGFAWRPNLVVTAEEALAEDGEVTVVLPGGETAAAHLVGRDPTTDVAQATGLLRFGTPHGLAARDILHALRAAGCG